MKDDENSYRRKSGRFYVHSKQCNQPQEYLLIFFLFVKILNKHRRQNFSFNKLNPES